MLPNIKIWCIRHQDVSLCLLSFYCIFGIMQMPIQTLSIRRFHGFTIFNMEQRKEHQIPFPSKSVLFLFPLFQTKITSCLGSAKNMCLRFSNLSHTFSKQPTGDIIIYPSKIGFKRQTTSINKNTHLLTIYYISSIVLAD